MKKGSSGETREELLNLMMVVEAFVNIVIVVDSKGASRCRMIRGLLQEAISGNLPTKRRHRPVLNSIQTRWLQKMDLRMIL